MTTEFKLFPIADWKTERIFCWYEQRNFFTIIRTFEPLQISIETEMYSIGKGKMVFIGPGKSYDIKQSEQKRGCVITFTAFFYEKSIADAILLNSELFFDVYHLIQIIDACDNEVDFIKFIDRIKNNINPVFDLVIHNCIEHLLLDGMQGIKLHAILPSQDTISIRGIVNAFSMMIHKHYKEQTNVQFYADKLNITSRKLTEMCIAILGKTAKNTISDVVSKEAVRYIKYTDLSISQIAYEMGFTDESNFRHFVKRCTGNIPITYRSTFLP